MSAANFVLGRNLPLKTIDEVNRVFVNRFTGQHTPQWVIRERKAGKNPIPLYQTDYDWYCNTEFAVKRDGTLDQRVHRCISTCSPIK